MNFIHNNDYYENSNKPDNLYLLNLYNNTNNNYDNLENNKSELYILNQSIDNIVSNLNEPLKTTTKKEQNYNYRGKKQHYLDDKIKNVFTENDFLSDSKDWRKLIKNCDLNNEEKKRAKELRRRTKCKIYSKRTRLKCANKHINSLNNECNSSKKYSTNHEYHIKILEDEIKNLKALL